MTIVRAIFLGLMLLWSGSAFAQTSEEASKIVGFTVLKGLDERASKIVGFVVLCTPPGTAACPNPGPPPTTGRLILGWP